MDKKKERGFTLIELMMVVAIVGILAAVSMPRFGDMIRKAREAATKGNLSIMMSAITIYYSANEGIFPRPMGIYGWPGGYGHIDFMPVMSDYINKIPRGWHYCDFVPSGSDIVYPEGKGNWGENWLLRSYDENMMNTGFGCYVGYLDTWWNPDLRLGWSYCPDVGRVYLHCGSPADLLSKDLMGEYYHTW